jgi:hypothetical protein
MKATCSYWELLEYFKYYRSYCSSLSSYLGKHWFSVVCYHGGLVTIQSDWSVMKWFLGVFQYVIEICYSSLKYTPKVPRHKSTTNGWNSIVTNHCIHFKKYFYVLKIFLLLTTDKYLLLNKIYMCIKLWHSQLQQSRTARDCSFSKIGERQGHKVKQFLYPSQWSISNGPQLLYV